MTMGAGMLICVIGPEIEQKEKVLFIKDGYEIWNLKKFTLDSFVELAKEKIPPINNRVLCYYKSESNSPDERCITQKQFDQCSWAIFIPNSPPDTLVDNYYECMLLLNLYTPAFLYPMFYVSNMGVVQVDHKKRSSLSDSHSQMQYKYFKRPDFVDFFKTLLPQSGYGIWQLDRAQRWETEDWRLFVACGLFLNLDDYDNGKGKFDWQRESAEITTILESLFTAGDASKEEVGYRLRKRAAVLLSVSFPEIEKDIKKLYNERSEFIHGAFFERIKKESGRAFSNRPIPDFDSLHLHREHLRWALVAYLNLARVIKGKQTEYNDRRVINLLEEAIIDLPLRHNLLTETKKIFDLLPKSKYYSQHWKT